MSENTLIEKAIKIMTNEFSGVLDKGGNPYILHCLAVMGGVDYLGANVMCAAVLHDLIEDTSWTADTLRSEGFSDDIISMIQDCTKREDEEYPEFIKRAGHRPESRAIKIADLRNNMKIERLSQLDEKAISRLKKYHESYQYLISLS